MQQHGKICILFEMEDFHGWKTAALWEDLKFDLKHFAAIERLAMVGDRKWQKGMRGSAVLSLPPKFAISIVRRSAQHETGSREDQTPPKGRCRFSASSNRESRLRSYYNKISPFYDGLADRSEAPVRKAGLDLLKPAPAKRSSKSASAQDTH